MNISAKWIFKKELYKKYIETKKTWIEMNDKDWKKKLFKERRRCECGCGRDSELDKEERSRNICVA